MDDPSIRALIVAFDDVLVPTHALRIAALRDACTAEGLDLSLAWIEEAVAARSLSEALAHGIPGTAEDPTRATVVGLRAHDALAHALAHAPVLDPHVVRLMTATAARGSRVIVRADAPREAVSRALAATPLTELLTTLVCADDAGVSDIAGAWRRIDERLLRVGIPVASRAAIEVRPDAVQIAGRLAAHVTTWNPFQARTLPPA